MHEVNVFNQCVDLLNIMAAYFGTTYVNINVYVFCYLLPVVLVAMSGALFYQWRLIKKLRKV